LVCAATVADARDLLIASVLCDDPVMFIDDRWLYSQTDDLGPIVERDLRQERPRCLAVGSDLTIVGSGYSTLLASQARETLATLGVSAEVIDLRILNPFDPEVIVESVRKTGRLLVVDGSWRTCGMSAEVIAAVLEKVEPRVMQAAPARVTLPDAPAPTSRVLEKIYYPDAEMVVAAARSLLGK
jgi:pyruvate dehydrogenase E1 component beta subunit